MTEKELLEQQTDDTGSSTTGELLEHEQDIYLQTFSRESKEIVREIIQGKLNLIDNEVEKEQSDVTTTLEILTNDSYNGLSLPELQQSYPDIYTSYVDNLFSSVFTMQAVESYLISKLTESPSRYSFTDQIRTIFSSATNFYTEFLHGQSAQSLTPADKHLLELLHSNTTLLSQDTNKEFFSLLHDHVFSDQVLNTLFTSFHLQIKQNPDKRIKESTSGFTMTPQKQAGLALALGLTSGLLGLLLGAVFGKSEKKGKRMLQRGVGMGLFGGLSCYLLPKLLGKEKYTERLEKADDAVGNYLPNQQQATTPTFNPETGKNNNQTEENPLETARKYKEKTASIEYQKANQLGNSINHFRSRISYSQDVLGESAFELGESGAIIGSLSSLGSVEYLLSEDHLIERLSTADPSSFEELRSHVDAKLKGLFRKTLEAAIPNLPVIGKLKDLFIGKKLEEIEDKQVILQHLQEIFRKYHKVLVWLHQSDIALRKKLGDAYQTHEDYTQFLARPLIAEGESDALSILEKYSITEEIYELESTKLVHNNNKRLEEDVTLLEAQLQHPEEIDTQEVMEVCETIIDDADDYGARVRYQKIMSGLSVFFNSATFERGEILKATGYTDLAEGYKVTADKIRGQIDAGHPVTPENIEELIDTREKQIGLINELLMFSTMRTDVQQEGEQTIFFGGISINPKYIPHALKVRKGDVVTSSTQIFSGFRMMLSESALEGALQTTGGFLALDFFTYPLRRPVLMVNGITRIPGVREIVKYSIGTLHRISPVRHLLVKPVTAYTSRRVGVHMTRSMPFLGQYYYVGPGGDKLLVKDLIKGRISLNQATRLAPYVEGFGNVKGWMPHTNTSEVFLKAVVQKINSGVILSDRQAEILVKYRESPGVRKLLTLQRVAPKVRTNSFILNREIITQISQIDTYVTQLSGVHHSSCMSFITSSKDLAQCETFVPHRIQIIDGKTPTGRTIPGSALQKRKTSPEKFGKLFATYCKNFDNLEDVYEFQKFLVRMNSSNNVTKPAHFLRNAMKLWSKIKVDPSTFPVHTLNNHPRMSYLSKHLEHLNISEKLKVLKDLATGLLDRLKKVELPKCPYPQKINELVLQLKSFIHMPDEGVFTAIKIRSGNTVSNITQSVRQVGSFLKLGQLGKVLGPAIKRLGFGTSVGVGVISGVVSYNQSVQFEEINPDKARLYLTKGNAEIVMGVAGGALMFVPGVGWAIAPIVLGVGIYSRIHQESFEVKEKYYTNFYEMINHTKPRIVHHMIATALGNENPNFREFRARSGIDHNSLTLTTSHHAAKARIRADEITRNTDTYRYAWIYYLPAKQRDDILQSEKIRMDDVIKDQQALQARIDERYTRFIDTVGVTQTREEIRETRYTYGNHSGSSVPETYIRYGDMVTGPDIIRHIKQVQNNNGNMYRSLQTVLNATRYEHSIDIESLTPSDTDFYQHLVRLAKTDRMQLAFLYGQAHHFIKSRPEEVAEDDVVSKHYQMLDQFCAQENIHMRRPIQQGFDQVATKAFLETGSVLTAYGNQDSEEQDRLASFTPHSQEHLETWYGISKHPLENLAREIAVDVLDLPISELEQALHVDQRAHHGIYLKKGKLYINNVNEKDKGFALHTPGKALLPTLHTIEAEMSEAVQEKDMMDTESNVGEKELNTAVGPEMLAVVRRYIALFTSPPHLDQAIQDYVCANESLIGQRFQLPLSDLRDLYQTGTTDVARYLYKYDEDGSISRYPSTPPVA